MDSKPAPNRWAERLREWQSIRDGRTYVVIAHRLSTPNEKITSARVRGWAHGRSKPDDAYQPQLAAILERPLDWFHAADYVLDGETATPHPSELEAMREALFADLDGLRAIVLKIAEDKPLLPAELDALRTRSQPPGTSDEDNRPGQAA